jgi:hypothetical protein
MESQNLKKWSKTANLTHVNAKVNAKKTLHGSLPLNFSPNKQSHLAHLKTQSLKVKGIKRKYPKRKSPKRKSPKRKSPKRKSTKRKSTKRK